MTDSYPANLEIEIDRPRLTMYLRAQWLFGWVTMGGIFGIFFGVMAASAVLERVTCSWTVAVLASLFSFVLCVAVSTGIGGVLYLLFSHRLAIRYAEELRVTVEGPFLRLRQYQIVTTDRKLHFRAIVDYAAVQDPLMRLFGIHALQMTTTGGGQSATIKVPGVKECLKARDMLSEIDRLRENEA
jgi:membrane protein YdbS with pleckstrin-like domain